MKNKKKASVKRAKRKRAKKLKTTPKPVGNLSTASVTEALTELLESGELPSNWE